MAAFGVAGVISENVPLNGRDETFSVEILRASSPITAISLLALGASVSERDAAARRLRQAAVGLAEAQALAPHRQLGVGHRRRPRHVVERAPTGSTTCSRSAAAQLRATSRIHPADRDAVRVDVEVALADGQAFEMTHRVVLGTDTSGSSRAAAA